MRITRAAKVAAFPLLALVLVVALIACQGPVGPAGKSIKGETGGAGKPGDDGDDGMRGMDADPALQASTVATVIFNPGDANAWATETMMPIDLSTAFTGGAAGDRTYDNQTILNSFGELGVTLDEATGELTVEVADVAFSTEDHGDDTVIQVEAVDADGNDAVANIAVRLNEEPTITSQPLSMTVGTQVPAADAEALENYNNAAEIECVALNVCTVTLVATDSNNQDDLTWMYHTSSDLISVTMTEDGDGFMIMGEANKSGTAMVYVWARDEGGLPVNVPDTSGDEEEDNSMPRPIDDDVLLLTVTVDGAPYMSISAVGTVELDVAAPGTPAATGTVVGYVFDPDSTLSDLVLSATPAFEAPNGVVEFALGVATTDASPNGRPIYAMGRNTGSVTVTLTVHEEVMDDAEQPNQSTDHTITVTVS
jgi:hypothetical protein